MTRAELRKKLKRPRSVLRSKDISDPLVRRIFAVSERADARYDRDIKAILSDASLTDDARSKKWWKAFDRRFAYVDKHSAPLEKRFDREVRIPLLRSAGLLKSRRRR